MDITDKRTDLVLAAMYNAGVITTEQYHSALEETVKILEKSEKTQLYDMPYFVEYAVYDNGIVSAVLPSALMMTIATSALSVGRSNNIPSASRMCEIF